MIASILSKHNFGQRNTDELCYYKITSRLCSLLAECCCSPMLNRSKLETSRSGSDSITPQYLSSRRYISSESDQMCLEIKITSWNWWMHTRSYPMCLTICIYACIRNYIMQYAENDENVV